MLRPLVITVACALLAACAGTRVPTPKPAPIAGWQAAVGSLEVLGSDEICTAVLVRPDLIATVSHCLHPRGVAAAATSIVFTSSTVPTARSRGTAILGQGAEVDPGTIRQDLAQVDWALVRISPPINDVPPMAVAAISPAMARAELASGAQFYSAGYGSGAKTRLTQHGRCSILPPDPKGLVEGEYFFATTCIIRLGDSGGPVALVRGDTPKLIGLIVGFTQQPGTGESIGIVVSARAFGPYVGGALVSQATPRPGANPAKYVMN